MVGVALEGASIPDAGELSVLAVLLRLYVVVRLVAHFIARMTTRLLSSSAGDPDGEPVGLPG